MDKLVLEGGNRLRGSVKVSGAKNGCLAIMPACLLAPGVYNLTNTPNLTDVWSMSRLLNAMGAHSELNGDTLFLDEIGDMPADTQTRLLRVLADGEFYRVGGHAEVKVDVRIIAATHQNLEVLVNQNQFREDLFHRLNVIRVHIPKLADRQQDIPPLAEHFLQLAASELAVETKQLTTQTADFLATLPWPGNVRQLENLCRWLTVMAAGREILISDLPPELGKENREENSSNSPQLSWQEALRTWAKTELKRGKQPILDYAMPTFETIMINAALEHTQGRRREAAEALGWGRNTLTRKIKELGMEE